MQSRTGRISDAQAISWLKNNPGEVQASLTDPFVATHQTAQYMAALIHAGAKTPVVKEATQRACDLFRGGPLYASSVGAAAKLPAGAICESIWWYVKHALKFVHHQKMLVAWLNRPGELQLLIAPDVLLSMENPRGDCAVYSTLICAMLECAGIPWELMTVAADPQLGPEVFSHVYPRSVLPGQRLPMDASHGKYCGWEVPADRVLNSQVWDELGNPIADQGSRFQGLHGVGTMAPNVRIDIMRQLARRTAGLGCCQGLGDDAIPLDVQEGGTYEPPPPTDVTVFNPNTSGGGSTDWTNLFGSLATTWTKAIAPAVGQSISPTTQVVRNADGSYSVITPGSNTAVAGSLLGGAVGSSSLLMIGGLLIGGVLLISLMKK